MNILPIQKSFTNLPSPDISEILRYLGVKEADGEIKALIDACIREASAVISCRAVYREYEITKEAETLDLGFAKVCSRDLEKNLCGCTKIILLAATLGSESDRLLNKYSRISPARAVVLDAVLTERIEAFCDELETELTEGRASRPRFSAGYGDLALELQREIFSCIDCERKIGLTLSKSLLMSPSKSVTAIIGIE